jgi:hypothetical protein
VGFQRPVKLTEITSWNTKKKRLTSGFLLLSLTIPMDITIVGSMNDKINMDSTRAGTIVG